MSEEDRLDPKKLWLWLDFETTGLDVNTLTVVQAGWTVTDSSLVQLIPIRARFCAVSAYRSVVTPVDPEWYDIPGEVISMHEQSGLTTEYEYTNPQRIVRSIGALDQLILDSLFEAGWDGDTRVVLAGAGVAGFDRLVLEALWSELLSVLHYRSADTSVACEVLGVPVPKSPEQFTELFERFPAADLSELRCASEFPGLHRVHRADVDVAAALGVARVLRSRLVSEVQVVHHSPLRDEALSLHRENMSLHVRNASLAAILMSNGIQIPSMPDQNGGQTSDEVR